MKLWRPRGGKGFCAVGSLASWRPPYAGKETPHQDEAADTAMGTDGKLFFWEFGSFRVVWGIMAGGLLFPGEEKPGPVEHGAVSRSEETVEAHLVKPFGTDVLEVSPDKFLG
jgi:hypothetical protein